LDRLVNLLHLPRQGRRHQGCGSGCLQVGQAASPRDRDWRGSG